MYIGSSPIFPAIKLNFNLKFKIMEYTVVVSSILRILIEQVNEKLKDGWKPQGGLIYKGDNYFQAMFKQCGS